MSAQCIFCIICVLCVPSVLWYCWLGLLTCKTRLPYNLYGVGGDVKHCSIQSNHIMLWLRTDCKNTAQISTQLSALTERRFHRLILPLSIWVDSPWLESGFCVLAIIFTASVLKLAHPSCSVLAICPKWKWLCGDCWPGRVINWVFMPRPQSVHCDVQ